MSLFLLGLFLLWLLNKIKWDLQWPVNSIKYPIIWGSDFDDNAYTKLPKGFSYATSYIDDAVLTDALYPIIIL